MRPRTQLSELGPMPSVQRDYEQRARHAQDAQRDYEDYLWQLLDAQIRDREAARSQRSTVPPSRSRASPRPP